MLMIRRIEHLGGFKNHLYHVLITVPSSTAACLATEKEDVHFRMGVAAFKPVKKVNFTSTKQ